VTLFSASLIFVWLVSFVIAQLLLKKAMEQKESRRFFDAHALQLLIWGIAAMTLSFFIKLGLLTEFDLSYLYPIEGLSVIIISVAAAMLLREKLTLPLVLGALLISAGVALVSTS
jgi:uncharacterized membrane protein